MKKIVLLVLGLGTLVLLPTVAKATTYTASKYYVGFEDTSKPGCDCDFNDLIISMGGSGLNLISAGILNNAFNPSNDGTPFWDNLSSDSTHANVGNCMYSSGSSTNTCTPSGATSHAY